MLRLNILEIIESCRTMEQKLSLALMYTGLRLPQYRVLNLLQQAETLTVTALSRKLRITRATASALANELLDAGLTVSSRNQADRRSFYMRLSETGQARLELAKKNIAGVQANMERKLNPEMIDALNEFARIMNKPAQKSAQAPWPPP